VTKEHPLSAEEILRLESLPHAAKIQHWGQERPWKGIRLPRNVRAVKTGHIFLDPAGNISKMPPLIGRPCFGQVTAFLRHGGQQQFWNPKTRQWMNSRCMRCPVRSACEYVVEERLRATPEIEAAYREWRSAGGRDATWKTKSRSHASNIYRDLMRLLKSTVQFSSINDPVAIDHYRGIVEHRLERDRQRQHRKRLAARIESARAGAFDAQIEDVLDRHRIWRQIRHAEAKSHPAGPPRLKQAPSSSSLFDAQVWLGKTRIELRREAPNPSNTAHEMQALGFELHRTQNALRVAVGRSLTRIAILERTRLPGRTELIWPKFGQRELREALDFDPLRNVAATTA
jgi:hypothetical protein